MCTAYAKSIGVAPAGRVFTSPRGVNTYTSSSKRSVRNVLRNSTEPVSVSLVSISCFTHSRHSASAGARLPPRLYAQWAAIPSSAVACIARVRTWISSGRPSGPITVVCSERYRFTFGIATKSLKRPGIGFHNEWIRPSAP